ncbi:MAG: SPOR domain-containing protein [Bacteroidetes bacterium]|nr:SPOR domain-containing protein [Bacteroidota bacterium]
MSNQTENTNNLVIEPNENNTFVGETPTNAPENDSTENTIVGEKRTTKGKVGILYSIIVILIIGGGAFYAYTFHRDFIAQYIPFIQTTQTNASTGSTGSTGSLTTGSATGAATNDEANNASAGSATDASTNLETNASTTSTTVSDEAVADAITESLQQSAAQQQSAKIATREKTITQNAETQSGFKKPLSRPCWVISVSSVAKESVAKVCAEELRAAGQKADYYWIPDYVSNGNKYFKVFVGTFATKAEAQQHLANGGLADGAYVLKVE